MIQDIVVNLAGARKRDPALNYAVSVAQAFEADLSAVAFCYDPVVMPATMEAMPDDFTEVQRAENTRAAQEAISRFKRATAKVELPAETKTIQTSVAGAPSLFGRIARTFDLSIAAQAEPDRAATDDLIIEAALFESGRPIIVVPYIQQDGFKLDRMMVCWDGSRTAARALADAMPLLEFAKSVEIVTVSNGRSDEAAEQDVSQHLIRHGLKAQTKRIAADGGDVASALLSYAADSAADLMVMGGYGHSRLREFFLGGVTRGILGAMTVPVLMSH